MRSTSADRMPATWKRLVQQNHPDSGSSGVFFSSRRRHTRWTGDWSSDVCSSDLDVRVFVQNGAVVIQVQERSAVATVDFAGIRAFNKDNLNKALRAVELFPGRYYDKDRKSVV